MGDILAQVRLEKDIGGAGAGQLAFERQADVFGDLGAGTVGTDQVAGPQRVVGIPSRGSGT